MTENRYLPPEQTPPCIDISVIERVGTLCVGCNDDCALAAIGRELQRKNTLTKHVIQDDVIPEFYGPKAIEILVEDPAFVEEILQLEWGILDGDVRGLKGINDDFGKPVGDLFLRATANRTGMLRFTETTTELERRRVAKSQDFGLRPSGGDEIAYVVRNILPTDPPVFERRAQDRFSIQQAIADDRIGKLPIIANFTTVHASEFGHLLPKRMPDTPQERAVLAKTIFNAVHEAADALSNLGKEEQYREMWELVILNIPEYGSALPRDKRVIIDLFYQLYCPNFWSNREEMLRNWQQYI